MKRIFFVALISVLLAACGGKDTYKIKGTVEGLEDGTVVTLNLMGYNSLAEIDSAIVKNGKFTFKGETDTAEVAVITFDLGDNIGGCEMYLERGDIDVLINVDKGFQRIGGTPNNNAFQGFVNEIESLNDEVQELEDKIRITLASQGDCTDYYKQMGELQDRYKKILSQNIYDNAGMLHGYRQLMENYTLFEPEEVMGFLEELAPAFGGDLAFAQLTAITNAQLSVSLGHPYVDFEAPILNKKGGYYETTAKLSDYVSKNKIVLLDFWASWCTPCINEIPFIKAAYKKYKSKGFEVVSVSVDEETDEWINAVKDNGMNWVQLWNGDDDMDNSAAVKYSISAIPSTFLIDADGTIIGLNLRETELEEALEDYFKNK